MIWRIFKQKGGEKSLYRLGVWSALCCEGIGVCPLSLYWDKLQQPCETLIKRMNEQKCHWSDAEYAVNQGWLVLSLCGVSWDSWLEGLKILYRVAMDSVTPVCQSKWYTGRFVSCIQVGSTGSFESFIFTVKSVWWAPQWIMPWKKEKRGKRIKKILTDTKQAIGINLYILIYK